MGDVEQPRGEAVGPQRREWRIPVLHPMTGTKCTAIVAVEDGRVLVIPPTVSGFAFADLDSLNQYTQALLVAGDLMGRRQRGQQTDDPR